MMDWFYPRVCCQEIFDRAELQTFLDTLGLQKQSLCRFNDPIISTLGCMLEFEIHSKTVFDTGVVNPNGLLWRIAKSIKHRVGHLGYRVLKRCIPNDFDEIPSLSKLVKDGEFRNMIDVDRWSSSPVIVNATATIRTRIRIWGILRWILRRGSWWS